VTLQNIADACGVSRMTVSRALQGKTGNMSPATFERIRNSAKEMGYVRDHRISELASYLADQRRGVMIQGELAYLHILEPSFRDQGRNQYFFDILHQAAPQYGYRVEAYEWSGQPGIGLTETQLERIWDARGVKGIFIGPQVAKHPPKLNWEKYSLISMGDSLRSPVLHRVDSDFRQATEDCCRKLHQLGFKRIGLIAILGYDRAMRFAIRGGFEAFHFLTAGATRLDIMGEDLPMDGERYSQPIHQWIREQQPDVIVSGSEQLIKLQELGYSVPEDFSFATWLSEPSRGSGHISGIRRAEQTLSKTCVELLISQINHGVRGIPLDPIQTKVEGHWADGETIRLG